MDNNYDFEEAGQQVLNEYSRRHTLTPTEQLFCCTHMLNGIKHKTQANWQIMLR
jgi:hypothetical protein